MAKLFRNVDRPEIKTRNDAIVIWMRETQPPEYAKLVEGGYSDEDGYSTWWEPARYELHQIIDWMLSPVTKRRNHNEHRDRRR